MSTAHCTMPKFIFSAFRAISFGALLLSPASIFIKADYGVASCPCLTLEEKMEMNDGWINPSFEDSLTEEARGNATEEEMLGFGVGCGAHSIDGQDNQWCYVDPANCDLKYSDSDIFRSLYYSYAACGYPDEFLASAEKLRSVDLRVVYKENYRGYQGTVCPDEDNISTCYGTVIDFAHELIQHNSEANVTFAATKIPQWIVERAATYPPFLQDRENMAHAACVYAVSLGAVDLCLGAYTKTLNRGLISSFLEMGVTSEYLIVGDDVQKEDAVTNLMNIFNPFSPSLWITTFGVFIFLSLLYVSQERPWSEIKEDPINKTLGLAIYRAGLGFFAEGHEVEDPPSTWGGRFTLLAIAVQVLLTTASYTANLTNFLVREGLMSDVNSIGEAIRRDLTVCVRRSEIAILDTAYGVNKINYAINPEDGLPGFEFRSELVESMDKGICQCAVIGNEAMELYHGRGDHCDKHIVGTPVLEMPWGIPVSNRFSDPLRTIVTKYMQTGNWKDIQNDAKPNSMCSEQEIDAENTQLKINHMYGAYLLSGILAFIGIMFSLASFAKKRRKKMHDLTKFPSPTNRRSPSSPMDGTNPRSEDSDDTEKPTCSIEDNRDLQIAMANLKDDIVTSLKCEISELKQLVVFEREMQGTSNHSKEISFYAK